MINKEKKTYILTEMKEMYIGKKGTSDRNLTQEQLVELIGVQKLEISDLESS